MRNSVAVFLAVISVGFVMSGCGRLNMEKHYQNYRTMLINQDYQTAVKYVEGKKKDFYGDKNVLLFYMTKGMILHLGKQYKDSNVVLEQAKTTAQELFTRSRGEKAAAIITNPNKESFQGEDFEKVMINMIAAYNYMGLKDMSAARVEARQITNKLELYNQMYAKEAEGDDKVEISKNYSDDAFARWLSGMLAETGGDQSALNDAWIDYKKAIDVYRTDYAARYKTPLPKGLLHDAFRALEGLGSDFQEEYQELQAAFPGVTHPSYQDTRGKAKVVFIHSAGESPYKVDKTWTVKTKKGPLKVAYPVFVAKKNRIVSSRIKVSGVQVGAELAENVTAIAIKNLADHIGRIKGKAIAIAIAKFVAGVIAQEAGKKAAKKNKAAGGILQAAGALWNVGQAAAATADKRSWIDLPSRINVAHTYVEPGDITLEIELLGPTGAVVKRDTLTGQAKAGETLFLTYRSII